MKTIIDKAEYILSAVLVVIGTCTIVMAFFNSPIQLQIVMGLAGIGFISLGILQLKTARDKKKDGMKFELICAKLDEIKQELEKIEEKPNGKGIAIADIISSGLKYYTEHMNRDKDEEQH
jgi:hypothetical protein